MKKTVVIHQPDFLSYLGFFHRFLAADLWIILDHVQFVTGTARSWQNRDQIKTSNGATWLTVAVQKNAAGTPINEVILSDRPWRRDNLNLLINSYRKAPFFSEIMPYLEELYAYPCDRMVDFNLRSVAILLDLFDIRIDMIKSSQLRPEGKSNQMLVDLLQKTGATHYLSGVGAGAYFDQVPFDEAGIEVVWQNFVSPVYPQLFGDFVANLSSVDMLFNCGIDESRRILRSV